MGIRKKQSQSNTGNRYSQKSIEYFGKKSLTSVKISNFLIPNPINYFSRFIFIFKNFKISIKFTKLQKNIKFSAYFNFFLNNSSHLPDRFRPDRSRLAWTGTSPGPVAGRSGPLGAKCRGKKRCNCNFFFFRFHFFQKYSSGIPLFRHNLIFLLELVGRFI